MRPPSVVSGLIHYRVEQPGAWADEYPVAEEPEPPTARPATPAADGESPSATQLIARTGLAGDTSRPGSEPELDEFDFDDPDDSDEADDPSPPPRDPLDWLFAPPP